MSEQSPAAGAPGNGADATMAGGPQQRTIPPSGVLLLSGVLMLILGVMVLAWPGKTLVVVAVLFGIQLMVMGIIEFAAALSSDGHPLVRLLVALLGLAVFVVGVICLFHPFTSLRTLIFVVAITWIADGIAALMHGFHGGGGFRWGSWLFGVVLIVGGLVLVSNPGFSLLVLTRVTGWILVGVGLAQLFVAANELTRKPAVRA